MGGRQHRRNPRSEDVHMAIRTPEGNRKKRHLDQIIRRTQATATGEIIPETRAVPPGQVVRSPQVINVPQVFSRGERLVKEEFQAGSMLQPIIAASGSTDPETEGSTKRRIPESEDNGETQLQELRHSTRSRRAPHHLNL